MVGARVLCYLLLVFVCTDAHPLRRSHKADVVSVYDPAKYLNLDEAIPSDKPVTDYNVESNATVSDVTKAVDENTTTKSPFVIERGHMRTLKKKAKPAQESTLETTSPAAVTAMKVLPVQTTLKIGTTRVKIETTTSATRRPVTNGNTGKFRMLADNRPATKTGYVISTTSRSAVPVVQDRHGWSSDKWRDWASDNWGVWPSDNRASWSAYTRRPSIRIPSNWNNDDPFKINPW